MTIQSMFIKTKFAVACALVASASQASAETYSLTDLSAGQSGGSIAAGINNVGQVVGTAASLSPYEGWPASVVWTGTRTAYLDTLGGYGSRGNGINNLGQVVGVSDTNLDAGNLEPRAAIWNGSSATRLQLPSNYVRSSANAINDSGQVVGTYWYGTDHAFLWKNGTAVALRAVKPSWDDAYDPSTYSNAVAINKSGQIVGASSVSADMTTAHATIWNDGVPTELGALNSSIGPVSPYFESLATSINDAGTVVGYSHVYTGGGVYAPNHATLWVNGAAIDLGALPGDLRNQSYAYAINNANQVVGSSEISYATNHATLWDGSNVIDLNSLLDPSMVAEGWVLNSATGINDSGWIAGSMSNDMLGITGHAFLLTPVPEPSAWAMMLIGLLGAGCSAWRVKRRDRSVSP